MTTSDDPYRTDITILSADDEALYQRLTTTPHPPERNVSINGYFRRVKEPQSKNGKIN